MKLRRQVEDRTITAVVPLHKELAKGTFKGILELAEVDEQEFLKNI